MGDKQVKYDFLVAPGANPGQISLAFAGADKLEVDKQGDLVTSVAGVEIHHHLPHVYQDINGARQPVEASYKLLGNLSAGFELGSYDLAYPLVIDPELLFLPTCGSIAVSELPLMR